MDYTTSYKAAGRFVRIVLQGAVLKASVKGSPGPNSTGRRGKVTSFSSKSRRRLMTSCLRVDRRVFSNRAPFWVSVTYPQEVGHKGWHEAQRDFWALWRKIERIFPGAACHWREDYQKRGEPHFHLIIWNVPIFPRWLLLKLWKQVIGYDHPNQQVHSERIVSYRMLVGYIGKYMAKCEPSDGPPVGPSAVTLDTRPYLNIEGDVIGRCWGTRRAELVPWAVPIVAESADLGVFYRLRRCARRHPDYRKYLKRATGAGFSVWSDSGSAWLGLASYFAEGQLCLEGGIS